MFNLSLTPSFSVFIYAKRSTQLIKGRMIHSFLFFLSSLIPLISMPSFAQSCTNNEIRFQKLSTSQAVENGIGANCAFDFTPMFNGGQTGITVYTHVTGQYFTPNSAISAMLPNSSGKIMGCIVPSTTAGMTWDIVQNSTACLTPSPKTSLAITKVASQNPFVVGRSGQSYSLNISINIITNPAPISITDILPAGISTSGPISGPAGLSGCPSAGATSLAGCTLPANLPIGNHSITVPINVAGNVINGNNTASITSVGATCGSGNLPCNSSVNVDILNAVDDVASAAAGSTGSINVIANDKYPAGQPNFQQQSIVPGGTCAGAQFTANGVISYTAPAAGTTCTVKYQFCHQGLCDTAALTVTGTIATAIGIGKVASHNPLVVGNANQNYVIKIDVQTGVISAAMRLTDMLPAGIVTSGPITIVGGSLSGCPSAGASSLAGCTIAAGVAAGTVIYITIPVTVGSTATTGANTASVTGGFAVCNNLPQANNCSSSTGPVGVTSPIATINVNLTGLPLGGTVALQNNGTGNINAIVNGISKYTTTIGSVYAVTAATQTPGVTCTVANGNGTVTANVTNVTVSCTSRFTLLAQSSTSNHPNTDCVKDTVTGLIWEGKPTSGTRMHTGAYTNFDSTTLLQFQSGNSYIAPTAAQISASNNSVGYLNAVNGSSVCGFSGGWRIPTASELFALSNAIGTVSSPLAAFWVPNTNGSYLSSTAFSSVPAQQHFAMGKNFMNSASPINYGRNILYRIRLVR
jgi:Protein of unknown function (DUF1566)